MELPAAAEAVAGGGKKEGKPTAVCPPRTARPCPVAAASAASTAASWGIDTGRVGMRSRRLEAQAGSHQGPPFVPSSSSAGQSSVCLIYVVYYPLRTEEEERTPSLYPVGEWRNCPVAISPQKIKGLRTVQTEAASSTPFFFSLHGHVKEVHASS